MIKGQGSRVKGQGAGIQLTTPLSESDVEQLHVGDKVLISGVVYTARDASHRRLVEAIDKGRSLPFDPKGQIIYYAGPTPARPGKVIGAVGPTTSSRMDRYTPTLLAQGVKGFIGKGERSEEVRSALTRHKAVYFAATAGAGALLSQYVKKAKIIAYQDLGPEAIYELEVEDFPVIVAGDIYGGDVFKEGRKKWGR